MKLHDTLCGLLILLFGIAIIGYAQTFPPMPGQNVGPSLFPTLIGSGFVLFALAMMISGLRVRGGNWIELDDWLHRPRMAFNFVLVNASLVFYALAVDRLGFFITAFLFLCVLFVGFGVVRKWIVPIALAVTLLIHYGFYTLLRVPLPWGLFEGIAW